MNQFKITEVQHLLVQLGVRFEKEERIEILARMLTQRLNRTLSVKERLEELRKHRLKLVAEFQQNSLESHQRKVEEVQANCEHVPVYCQLTTAVVCLVCKRIKNKKIR